MKSSQIEAATAENSSKGMLLNRTGIMLNPQLGAELLSHSATMVPQSNGGSEQVIVDRADYLSQGLPIGSLPAVLDDGEMKEPASRQGPTPVLLDKLGERLAFERQGTRLYEAFIQKLEILSPDASSGPSLEDLRHICDEELEHLKLLQRAILGLSGDATVQTPAADIAGVISQGVVQIVSDPRTTIPQTLQAILTAELADNDGWQMLGELAGELGHKSLEAQCEKALEQEQEHLENVRAWLSEMTLENALDETKSDSDTRPSKTRSSTGKSRKRRKKK
jgi:rubrerythrin